MDNWLWNKSGKFQMIIFYIYFKNAVETLKISSLLHIKKILECAPALRLLYANARGEKML